MDAQQYLNDRVEHQIKYYSNKSAQNKSYYLFFKVAQLIAAALLPFLSAYISESTWVKYSVGVLGTLVAILEGVLAVGKYHEKWVSYRATGEALRQEKFLFLMKAGEYNGGDTIRSFVNRIELILGKENMSWQQMIVQEKEREDKGKSANEAAQDTGTGVVPVTSAGEVSSGAPGASAPASIDPITGVSADPEELHEEP